MIYLMLPLRTVNELNAHEHWRVRQRRAKAQHNVVKLALWNRVYTLRAAMSKDETKRLAVQLTRYSRGKLDSDGAVAAGKFVRDAVAECLGVDDGEERVTWHYRQERVPKGFAIQIRIEEI